MSSDVGSSNDQNVTREAVLSLMQKRTSIDEQIDALGGILAANRVGMREPVTDAEGYPRNDIDVYQVRHARQKIICLQNDRKKLTEEIESKLTILHDNARRDGTAIQPMEVDSKRQENLSPIAIVNFVADASPAFQAGLRVNDKVISVGSIDARSFTGLSDIGNLVQRCQGSVINVCVDRDGSRRHLALIPGPWSGRGLIGCNIVPVDTPER